MQGAVGRRNQGVHREKRDNLSPVPRKLGGARKRFNQKGKIVAKKRRLSPKKGRVDDWARVISRIPIIPALFHHNFGGDAQGVLGACPFETLHQYQLGVLKYILGSLYNYCHIPDYFLQISHEGPSCWAGGTFCVNPAFRSF